MSFTDSKHSGRRPIPRVFHIIDGLGRGGSERLLVDLISSTSDRVQHRVVTVFPDVGEFIYAPELESKKVYLPGQALRFVSDLQRYRQRTTVRSRPGIVRKLTLLPWIGGALLQAFVNVVDAVSNFRPTVIHGHTFFGFPFGLLARRISGLPFVYTVPALIDQLNDAGMGRLPREYRRFHRDVSFFFTGASRNDLRELGVPEPKIKWLEGTIDFSRFPQTDRARQDVRQQTRDRLSLPPDARLAVVVGRLHRSKGQRFAIETVRRLRDLHVHCVVVGEGSDELELRGLAAAEGVADRVHFVGFQSDPIPYYLASDIYLRTSLFEGENLSSYQAMAASLPVIGFRTGAETELIDKVGHGLLVPPSDADAMAAAARKVLADPQEKKLMGNRGLTYAKNQLPFQRTIDVYMEAYERLTSAGST